MDAECSGQRREIFHRFENYPGGVISPILSACQGLSELSWLPTKHFPSRLPPLAAAGEFLCPKLFQHGANKERSANCQGDWSKALNRGTQKVACSCLTTDSEKNESSTEVCLWQGGQGREFKGLASRLKLVSFSVFRQ